MMRRRCPLKYGAAGLSVWLGVALGVLLGVTGLMLKARDGSHPVWDLVFGGVAGFLFLGTGLLAHARRPRNRVGLLMVLVAVGFFAEDLQFARGNPIHALAMPLTQASTAFAVHLLLAFPMGRLVSRLDRAAAIAAYAAVFVLPWFALVWWDPASHGVADPPNPYLIADRPAVHDGVIEALNVVNVMVGAAVLVALIRHWARASAPMRRVLFPVFGTGLIGTCATVIGLLLPDGNIPVTLLVYKVAFCLLPLAFLAGVLRLRIGPAPVDKLLVRLRLPGPPHAMREVLAHALGDPSLQVGYWDPARMGYADEWGRPLALPPEGSLRSTTAVQSDGRRIAVLIHDPALEEDRPRLEAVAAGAALALDRQRLREDIAVAMDAERRRIERDLHDGAQQSLVLAMLQLNQAVEELGGRVPARLAAGIRSLDTANDELRELARGGHPALLGAAGLGPALEALIERMPLRVDARLAAIPRLPERVEAAAYFMVKEILTNIVKHAGASRAWVTVAVSGSRLEVEVGDDGIGGAAIDAGSGLAGLHHRALAIGGHVIVDSPVSAGTRIRATLPCGDVRR